jgi:hypothetical protein
MKLSKIYTLIVLSTVAHHASAENYTNEFSIGFSNGDKEIGALQTDGAFSSDTESIDLGFVANFTEVDTSKGPLAEAGFLDRASNFSIAYSDGEIDTDDTTDLTLGLRLAGKDNGLTGELLFVDREAQDTDTEHLGLSVGYSVATNT